jgi:hypothetical protein
VRFSRTFVVNSRVHSCIWQVAVKLLRPRILRDRDEVMIKLAKVSLSFSVCFGSIVMPCPASRISHVKLPFGKTLSIQILCLYLECGHILRKSLDLYRFCVNQDRSWRLLNWIAASIKFNWYHIFMRPLYRLNLCIAFRRCSGT